MATSTPLPTSQRPSNPAAPANTTAATGARNPAVAAASEVNKVRIVHVTHRLALHFGSGFRSEPFEFFQLCFALARGIDYAISHNDIPPNAHDLPPIIKQVYQRRNESFLQSAILVLLISAKNACRNGWFQTADSDELLTITNEMASMFCMADNITSESTHTLHIISKVIPRYYPRMNLSRLIASFKVKPGYEIVVADIFITRNMAPEERIRLFVAQSDNLATSTCIVTPQQVNFLINGKGVEKRTNVSLDNGPQFPTDITKMLKYGMNLFQAIGSFNGNYIIAIAVMSMINSSDVPELQDYVQSAVAAIESDTEIIEGPSRITLNCPISFKRIKVPIKGHLCKHHQCFDFNNFMEMNSRKPSWRCPHCNQPVCYTDIRIDQNMVKILREAGEGVSDVIISADGTWEVAEGNNSNVGELHNRTLTGTHDSNVACKPIELVSCSSDVVDLTSIEDFDGDAVISSRQLESPNIFSSQSGKFSCETEDRKPFRDDFQGLPFSGLPGPGPTSVTTQTASHASMEMMSSILPSGLSSNLLVPHEMRTNGQTIAASESCINALLDPVITDTASPALIRGSSYDLSRVLQSTAQSTPQVRQVVNALQSQQQILGNSIISSDQRPPIPRHVNRTPIAIQALPAQTQQRSCQKRPLTDGINAVNDDTERHQFSRISGMSRISGISSSSTQLQSMLQPSLHHACSQIVGLPAHSQASLRPMPDQLRGADHSVPILQPHLDVQNSRRQHLNVQAHKTVGQLTNVNPLSPCLPSAQVQQVSQNAIGVSSGSLASQQSISATANRAARLARLSSGVSPLLPSITMPSLQTTVNRVRSSIGEQVELGRGLPQTGMSSGCFPELPSEQNWRPTGRMRGSLTGGAYSAALTRYMVQPVQTSALPSAAATAAAAVANGSSNMISTVISDSADDQTSTPHQRNLINGNSG